MTSHSVLCLQPSLRVSRAGTWLTVHRPLQVCFRENFLRARSGMMVEFSTWTQIYVLFGIAMPCGSDVILVVESFRLCSGYATSHAISSIKWRTSNFSFSWCTVFLTCFRLLYESIGAGTWLTVHRAPQVERCIDIFSASKNRHGS